ncbi:MAG: hypothetical protein ACRDRU_25060 [Pseudonocardiaceae bacterium]
MADGATGDTGAPRANRRAIGIACALHRGPRGFANLVVEKQGGEIVFDMHVTGACVMIFEEGPAQILRDALIEWLG